MTFSIGKFRAGMWLGACTITLLVAALYRIPGQSDGVSAMRDALPGIGAGLCAVIGTYLIGASVQLRVGIVAGALLLGNFAFLEAGRYPSSNPDFFVMALQCWLFLGVGYFRSGRWWGLALLGFFALSLAAWFSWPHPGFPAEPNWRGVITGVIGAIGAVFYCATLPKWRHSANTAIWFGALLWGGFNLAIANDPLLMTLAPAALLGSWLLCNPDHRKRVRLVGGGVLAALRLVPVFICAMWVFTWWSMRAGGIQIPLLLPLILLATLSMASLFALRFFKYNDRRTMIVCLAAAGIALWQIMLLEPVRQQQTAAAVTQTAPASTLEVIDVATEPVLQNAR